MRLRGLGKPPQQASCGVIKSQICITAYRACYFSKRHFQPIWIPAVTLSFSLLLQGIGAMRLLSLSPPLRSAVILLTLLRDAPHLYTEKNGVFNLILRKKFLQKIEISLLHKFPILDLVIMIEVWAADDYNPPLLYYRWFWKMDKDFCKNLQFVHIIVILLINETTRT